MHSWGWRDAISFAGIGRKPKYWGKVQPKSLNDHILWQSIRYCGYGGLIKQPTAGNTGVKKAVVNKLGEKKYWESLFLRVF